MKPFNAEMTGYLHGVDKEYLDDILFATDMLCLAQGLLPVSVFVQHDDGSPSTAFLKSAEKQKLRLPGESDTAMQHRIAALVSAAMAEGKYDDVQVRYSTS